MQSLLDVFLSMESTAVISLLSMYSTSGLFKESQVDIDSSIEIERLTDWSGETFIVHGAGATLILESTALLFEKAVFLLETTTLGFTLEQGRVGTEKLAFVEAEDPFLTLTIFAVHGTYKFKPIFKLIA